MVRSTIGLFYLLLWCALSATGCARQASQAYQHAPPTRHLLFNPEWTGLPLVFVPRSDWPETFGYESTPQTIAYQETIYDRQGRFHNDEHSYYREFDSVRVGYIRR